MKNPKSQFRLFLLVAGSALTACAGGSPALPRTLGNQQPGHPPETSPIAHVVLIVQENRSFNNLFATFPGAHGATRGKERIKKNGKWIDQWVTLKSSPLAVSYDLGHCRPAYLTAYDGGAMDGFNQEVASACSNAPPAGTKPYQYVETSQIQPYWNIAKQWVLADETFQTQGSGSFTAHQDLVRGGTCINACSTPGPSTVTIVDNPTYWPWGCDAPSSVVTDTVDISGNERENGPYPCSNKFPNYGQYTTLGTLLD